MAGDPPTGHPGPENPLEVVFEKAVQPFADGAALRAALPTGAPVIVMRKADDVPTETRDLEGGGTVTIPVLGAIKDSTMAGWHRAGEFDFGSMRDDEIAVAFLERAGGPPDLKIVTRAAGGALLCADLGGMLDALKAIVDNAAFKAFPGGDFLVEALTTGIEAAKKDLLESLAKPDASGKSLIEQFRERAPRKPGAAGRTRKGKGA